MNIQQLPLSWAEASVGDLVGYDGLFCDGDWVESKDQDRLGDVRLIQLADVGDGYYRNRSNRFLTSLKAVELRCTFLKQGDLLVARMPDPLGRVCIFPGDEKLSVTVVDVCVIRLASSVDSRWLMHQLNTPQIRQCVAAMQSGSTRKRISRANFAKVRFPIPPLAEQERIAAVADELFSDLDSAVVALERVCAKLRLYRASVLKAAVEGALTEEWRAQHRHTEPASELLKRILAERRRCWEREQLRKFKEKGQEPSKNWKEKYREPIAPATNLPALPNSWCWVTLDQLLWQLRSGTPETSGRNPTDYPVLKSSAVRHGVIDFEDLNYLQRSQILRAENFLRQGDFLITRLSGSVDYVGCSAIVKAVACEAIQYPDRIFCGKLVPGIDGTFLTYCFRHSHVRKSIEEAAKSTAGHQRISMSDLYPLVVPLPPLAEQEAIVETVEDQLSVIERVEADLDAKLRSAQSLRQAILRHAFNGHLVLHDPNDEPASDLLAQIAAERETRECEADAVKRGTKRITRTQMARSKRTKKDKVKETSGPISNR